MLLPLHVVTMALTCMVSTGHGLALARNFGIGALLGTYEGDLIENNGSELGLAGGQFRGFLALYVEEVVCSRDSPEDEA